MWGKKDPAFSFARLGFYLSEHIEQLKLLFRLIRFDTPHHSQRGNHHGQEKLMMALQPYKLRSRGDRL